MIGNVPRRTPQSAVAAQIRVIGALFMRELLTRFGTSRIGYVWLVAEPMLLGLMISLMHWASGHDLPNQLPTFLFYALGYVPFFMFRSIVNRGSNGLQANISLLFHRSISPHDVMLARNLMEAAVCTLVVLCFQLGGILLADEWPEQQALFLCGLALSALLANGLGALFASLQVFWEPMERLVHPFTYLLMPLSAPFYMVDSLAPEARDLLLWNPLVHVHEMNRWALFGDRVVSHYDVSYVLAWILGLNLLGLAGLRAARPRLSMMD